MKYAYRLAGIGILGNLARILSQLSRTAVLVPFSFRGYNRNFDLVEMADISSKHRLSEGRVLFVMRIVRSLLLLAMLFAHGCASVQVVSEKSVDNKLAQVKLGVTTKAEIENLFGTEHGAEKLRWVYNLSDTELGISDRMPGSFPVAPAILPTNTRALITVRFTESGTVNGLEVERFFDRPFTNDYWYLVKGDTENILESTAHAGETSKFRVVGFDKSAGRFALEDNLSKGRITVKLEKQTLHITSINPHNQVTNEYRVFTKRESAFIDKISALTAEAIVSAPATPQQDSPPVVERQQSY